LLIRNPYNTEFSERVAFVSASNFLQGLTADRTEFLGRLGSLEGPAALKRIGLIGTVEAGLERGTTLVIVTHDPEIAEQTQRIIYLRDGLVEENG